MSDTAGELAFFAEVPIAAGGRPRALALDEADRLYLCERDRDGLWRIVGQPLRLASIRAYAAQVIAGSAPAMTKPGGTLALATALSALIFLAEKRAAADGRPLTFAPISSPQPAASPVPAAGHLSPAAASSEAAAGDLFGRR